jgi:hypothetical protein
MAARGFMVIKNTTITYDGVQTRLHAGQKIDVPVGSALATALGANIVALTSQQQAGASGEHQPIASSLNLGSHFNPGQN